MVVDKSKFFLWPFFETHPWRAVVLMFFSFLGVIHLLEDIFRATKFYDASGDWLIRYLLVVIFTINGLVLARGQARILRGDAKRCSCCRSAIELSATECKYCSQPCEGGL